MKKNYLALMCMASMAIVTACGGGNANKQQAEAEDLVKSEIENTDQKPEKSIEDMIGIEQAEYWLTQNFNLTLADVKPDFEYEAQEKGMDGCMGNKGGGTFGFIKKDGTPITDDDFKAYVSRIYPLVQKISPTGKIHKGPGKFQNNSEEVQKQELALDDIDFSKSVDLAFPKKDDFAGGFHHITIYNRKGDKPSIALHYN